MDDPQMDVEWKRDDPPLESFNRAGLLYEQSDWASR